MTVIVWDGQTLAADKQSGDAWVKAGRATKIRTLRGHLVGTSGDAAHCREMQHWFESGAKPEDFPPSLRQLSNGPVTMIVITPERVVHTYQDTPFPIVWDSQFHAIGSGKEAALAVLMLGYPARRAVEIASVVCIGCGGGVDTLTFPEGGQA